MKANIHFEKLEEEGKIRTFSGFFFQVLEGKGLEGKIQIMMCI